MSDHPTREELFAFVCDALAPERKRAVVRHFLKGCAQCRAGAADAARRRPPVSVGDYDAAIDRAEERVLRFHRKLARERRTVREIVARLETEGLEAALQGLSPRKHGPALAEALLERSWALRHQDPARMVELAQLATLAARDLDVRAHGDHRVSDLRGRAWGELGNALRVTERLDEAEDAFHSAYDHTLLGSGDPLLLARLLDLHSSLYRARRKLGLARITLTTVYAIYKQQGQPHLAGRALIQMGIVTGYAGDPEKALRLLKRGLGQIDERRDPELAATAVHNQLAFMVEHGRYAEAERTLFKNRWRFVGSPRLSALRLRWLEGRIDAGLGRTDRAEEVFGEVRAAFDAAGLGFPAALASLDLALVLLRKSRPSGARDIVLDAAETFRGLGIQREMLAAVLFLSNTFRIGLTKVSLLEDVITYLRRAQHDPNASFDPRPL